jgi:transcriptional regulator with XRE-family HTH domain
MNESGYGGGAPQGRHRVVGQSLHVQQHAIIGTSSQVQSCDNRVCDIRNAVAKGAVAADVPLSPETADVFRRLEALHLKQKDLADALGIEPNKVSKTKAGERQFKGPELLKARQWLARHEDNAIPIPARLHSDLLPSRTADAGETVEIAMLDLSLPMGPGATVDDYIEEEPLRFDLGYIRGFTRTPPHRLRLARGVGDSMFPTLLSNDLVWIDSTQTTLNHSDRVWAVSINGGAAIKRLRPLKNGRVLVISDNPGPGHENYEVDADELLIGGRVIRFARDL